MKVLILDSGSVGLDLALRAQLAGHKVRLWAPVRKGSGKARVAGRGLVDLVPTWQDHMPWADLILTTDNCFYVEELEAYFKKGFPIFGCNRAAGELELDREKGQEVLRHAGLKIAEFQRFDSYAKARKFVLETGKTYVSKPIGEADKGLSYVSKSPADMVFKLDRWAKANSLREGFILQECVKGTEMAVGGWFGPSGWSSHFCENWEEKRLMNDGLGINTGEQGTTLRYVKNSALAKDVLLPMTEYLWAIDYVGFVDVNCIVGEDGVPYPLEFTMRFGWPLVMIQSALHEGDPVNWMVDLMEGRDTLKVREEVAVGVVLSHGDYPYGFYQPEENIGYPLSGITKGNKDQVHLVEVMLGEAPVMEGKRVVEEETLVTAGNYVLVVTGVGRNVTKARDACYATLWDIDLPSNRGFRTDIGKRLEEELPKLQKHGYALGMGF